MLVKLFLLFLALIMLSEPRCVVREADPVSYDYENTVSNSTEPTETPVTETTALPEGSYDQAEYPTDSDFTTETPTESVPDASPAEKMVEEEYKEQPVDTEPEESTEETTEAQTTTEASKEFPEPSGDQISNLVDAAKGFISEYITPKQWKNLKVLLKTVREIGGSRSDTHRTVNVYLARILTSDQKKRIMARQKELFQKFNNPMPINLPRRRE